jgi:hypothetical protein
MTLATTAHVVGGGSAPPVAVLVVCGLLVGQVAVTATARRCRFGALVALLAVEQVLLHWLFSASAATPGCHGVPLATAHHGGTLEAMGCADGTGDGLGPAALGSAAPAMWLAHAAAVLGTAWLLARGEVWLWRLAHKVVEAATATPADRPSGRRTVRHPAVRWLELPTPPASPAAPRGPPVRTKIIARV